MTNFIQMILPSCIHECYIWFAIFFPQLDINISPHLSSEFISYLENPVELLNEAAKAAEQDIWNLMQFTEDLRRQYGKEPRDMEVCCC